GSASLLTSYASRLADPVPLQPLSCLGQCPIIGHAASADFTPKLSGVLMINRHGLELHFTGDWIDACRQVDLRADAHPLLDLLLQLIGQIGIVAQVAAGVLASLSQLIGVVGEPSPRLANDSCVYAQINEAALAANSLSIENIELSLLEWWRHLIFDNLHPCPIADHFLSVF